LLEFLLQNDLLPVVEHERSSAAVAWRGILGFVARREADRVGGLTPDSVRSLIARIATLARHGDTGLGPISMDDMRIAFREVCGYEPDEEGLQLLLRLPGLATATVEAPHRTVETRRFVDIALAEAAYGEDLAAYLASPYASHPLARGVTWTAAAGPAASSVAAEALSALELPPGVATAAIRKRLDDNRFDAVLLDMAATADIMGADVGRGPTPFFSEVLAREVVLSGDMGFVSASTFKDCVIEVVDVRDLDANSSIPSFTSCLIGRIDGWTQVPSRYRDNFASSEIGGYTATAQTTQGLMGLSIDKRDRVALVVLKKVYAQAGNGRKESALPRGLPLQDRHLVADVTGVLVSSGYLSRTSGRGEDMLVPMKAMRARVNELLEAPHTFSLRNLKR